MSEQTLTGKPETGDSKEERLEAVAKDLYGKSYDSLEPTERRRVGSVVGGQSSATGYTDTRTVETE